MWHFDRLGVIRPDERTLFVKAGRLINTNPTSEGRLISPWPTICEQCQSDSILVDDVLTESLSPKKKLEPSGAVKSSFVTHESNPS
jgi:hypothetical protein